MELHCLSHLSLRDQILVIYHVQAHCCWKVIFVGKTLLVIYLTYWIHNLHNNNFSRLTVWSSKTFIIFVYLAISYFYSVKQVMKTGGIFCIKTNIDWYVIVIENVVTYYALNITKFFYTCIPSIPENVFIYYERK